MHRGHLRSHLGKFPNTPRSEFTPQQCENLRAYESKILAKYQKHQLKPDDICVVPIDRADGLVYAQNISVNCSPTLTTKNSRYLVILDVDGVVQQTEDSQREFCRLFRDTELFSLQGFPPELVYNLGLDLARKAAGNAYPPCLIIAVLQPMLLALATFPLATWPPSYETRGTIPTCVHSCLASFKAAPRFLPKAKPRRTKRQRASSSDSDD